MDIQRAQEILEKYNKDAFHLLHASVVSGVMRYYAKEYDPEHEEKWAIVGLLHDVDFELYPDDHCIKGEALLRDEDVPDDIIRSAMSHCWGISKVVYEPEHIMEKILFAADELTGLIGAAALMRPSKSVMDMELKSVKKKFKDKRFAAGCSREIIEQGVDMLGWELDELIERTILAMRTIDGQ